MRFACCHKNGEHLEGDAAFDSVRGGYGFDRSALDVIALCREDVGPLEDFDTATVRADLLPVLAHPFDKWDRPRVPDDNQDDWAGDIGRLF